MIYIISSYYESEFEQRLKEAKERGGEVLTQGVIHKDHRYLIHWAKVRRE